MASTPGVADVAVPVHTDCVPLPVRNSPAKVDPKVIEDEFRPNRLRFLADAHLIYQKRKEADKLLEQLFSDLENRVNVLETSMEDKCDCEKCAGNRYARKQARKDDEDEVFLANKKKKEVANPTSPSYEPTSPSYGKTQQEEEQPSYEPGRDSIVKI